MGLKKACDAIEGTCVRLVLLVAVVALGGLLEFVREPLGPLNAPAVVHALSVEGEPTPRRNCVARVEGRVCADMADPGRFGSVDAAVPGLPPVGIASLRNSSPSSEATSVMRDDIMDGACCEPELGNGFGKELVIGERRPLIAGGDLSGIQIQRRGVRSCEAMWKAGQLHVQRIGVCHKM